jgi:hypothetical protein
VREIGGSTAGDGRRGSDGCLSRLRHAAIASHPYMGLCHAAARWPCRATLDAGKASCGRLRKEGGGSDMWAPHLKSTIVKENSDLDLTWTN